MKYIEITLKEKNRESLFTEIMYGVASARVQGAQIVGFVFDSNSDEQDRNEKAFGAAIRVLRGLKEKKSIQFYATGESFEKGTREAEFLINKYPEIFTDNPEEQGYRIVVKL